jgi:hypothetical protein
VNERFQFIIVTREHNGKEHISLEITDKENVARVELPLTDVFIAQKIRDTICENLAK